MDRTLTHAALIGALSGFRSMAGPTLVSRAFSRTPRRRPGTVEGFLSRKDVALAFTLGAAGEILADKLPSIPARIAPAPLAGRVLFGALAGAAVAERGRAEGWHGAALGGMAAAATAFVGYLLRRAAGQTLEMPDPLLGAVEDAVVYGGGATLTRELE